MQQKTTELKEQHRDKLPGVSFCLLYSSDLVLEPPATHKTNGHEQKSTKKGLLSLDKELGRGSLAW